MTTASELESRTKEAERQAARALTTGMADCWRNIATGYRELAAEIERVRWKAARRLAVSVGQDAP